MIYKTRELLHEIYEKLNISYIFKISKEELKKSNIINSELNNKTQNKKDIESEWISVEDKLPEIKQGDSAISVIIAAFDHCHGNYDVYSVLYGKLKKNELFPNIEEKYDFMETYIGVKTYWGPVLSGIITHWMYFPKPPKTKPNIEIEDIKDEDKN